MNHPPPPLPPPVTTAITFPNQSSFSFLPPPPNPNPNPNLLYVHHENHPPPPPPPPPPDLPTALSLLKDLIRLSETTTNSIFSLLRIPSESDGLCRCPFNPHHRLPPESLFRHSLQCPSSPAILDPALIESLHYPNTLQSSEELIKQNRFVQTMHDPDAELCFSLEDYSDYKSNFFYGDCPGVVSLPDQDTAKRTFTLPGILSAECANFVGSGENQSKGLSKECLRLLPSELWLVRNDIEAWRDYPASFSYSILKLILSMRKEGDFLKWVVVNSPRYGIVIDVPMGEHIVLLFRLCLKAITREAVASADLLFSTEKELNVTTVSFKCTKLVEVMRWLSFQLSLLYGEANAKFFAIDMLKQFLIDTSQNSTLFPIVQKACEVKTVDGTLDEPLGRSVEDEKDSIVSDTIYTRVIFVSQVAAAVAALQERSLLEEKINAFRFARPLSNYQRVAEHQYISKRAEEERQKRPNYRPLLEHDGLIWQQSRNQDTNKMKTREELLAEERDYKRRRMSYRGKKLKRSTTQVMRDIIEEYMEEIKQAGGIGCLVKGEGTRMSEHSAANDVPIDDDLKKTISNSYEVKKGLPHGFSNRSQSQDNKRAAKFDNEYPEDHDRHRRDSHGQHKHREAHNSSRERDYRNSYSRSLDDEHRRNNRSNNYISKEVHQGDLKTSSKYSSREPSRSYDMSQRGTSHRREQSDKDLEVKGREQRKTSRNRNSDSVRQYAFEDRYDPTESYDMHGDDDSYDQNC